MIKRNSKMVPCIFSKATVEKKIHDKQENWKQIIEKIVAFKPK